MPLLKQCRRCQALIRHPKFRRQRICDVCNKSSKCYKKVIFYKSEIAAKRFRHSARCLLYKLRKFEPQSSGQETQMYERKAYLEMKINMVEKKAEKYHDAIIQK